jgi:hypothetical protein
MGKPASSHAAPTSIGLDAALEEMVADCWCSLRKGPVTRAPAINDVRMSKGYPSCGDHRSDRSEALATLGTERSQDMGLMYVASDGLVPLSQEQFDR